jgi:uncharacterized protein (TIGR02996 family)
MDALVALRDGLAREPIDWASWLVYADWLLEQGDPRGELVNLEHKLDTAKLSRDERLGLVRQRMTLQKEHEGQWLRGLTLPEGLYPRWRHGFIIGLTPGSLKQGLGATLSFLRKLQAHPAGLLLCTLDLSELRLGDAEAAQLASAPLGPLTRLLLGNNQIGSAGVVALSESAHLGALGRLDLSHNAVGTRGLTALLSSAGLAGLVQLDLRKAQLGPESLGTLRISPWQGLRVLRLSDNALGPADAEAIADCRVLGKLEQLYLARNALGDEGARALARAALPSLETLGLESNGIGDRGASALAESETLSSLRELLVQNNSLGPAGQLALSRLTERGCRLR